MLPLLANTDEYFIGLPLYVSFPWQRSFAVLSEVCYMGQGFWFHEIAIMCVQKCDMCSE